MHVKQSDQLGEMNLVNVQAVIQSHMYNVGSGNGEHRFESQEGGISFSSFFFNIIKPGKIQIEHEGVSNDRFNLHSFKVKKKPGFKNCMWWASSYASISQKPHVPMPIWWTCFLNCW